ncbi:LysR family substrate-binding domain-containing protein [Arthrobacter sp. efr-133-R2A-120]|uniref:LysR family substrate-binding domain-containing protein n=1 Tax=Arthrobacter sp. efr-133-R2A-120 TaxID=3040277 RepID=UPI00254F738A|nr:LysR family substrate-binding domain-containing protein [Arthrobacter sp. efr-133-R2A-120]
MAIAIPQEPPACRRKGGLSDFRGDSWVWLPRSISPEYHVELVAACRQAGFSPNAQHYANSINSQLAMVKCGLGVTPAPASSVRLQPDGLVWRDITERADLWNSPSSAGRKRQNKCAAPNGQAFIGEALHPDLSIHPENGCLGSSRDPEPATPNTFIGHRGSQPPARQPSVRGPCQALYTR